MTQAAPVSARDDELAEPFRVEMPPRPYPGLRPFDEAEWPIFFGRERMVDAVVAGLVRTQCIVVHGDSGAGKSSLIRAGVLPRLRHEQARCETRWRTCIALPRGGPLGNLARELAALDGRGDDAAHVLALRRLLNQGRAAPAALAGLLLRDEDDHLCILIDQFEELFEFARHGSASECRLLTDFIVRMAEAPPRGLYLALTMRSEFLGACARFPGLAEAVNQRQYLLPPMAPADLLRAIREPAALYGGHVEAALAERLAADAAGTDGLPLVQHALMRLHALGGSDEGWQLGLADYPADGLSGLLSRHADEVAARAAALPAASDLLVERLFRALTTVSPEGQVLRRPQPLAQLAEVCDVPAGLLAPVIDVFRADEVSFLSARHRSGALAGEEWIDIGHEALVRCWKRLSEPGTGWLVKEVRDGMIWRALLVQAESFEADDDAVLSSSTTRERQRWLLERNPAWAERHGGGWERVQALMHASVAARRRGLWIRIGSAVAVAAAVLTVSGFGLKSLADRRLSEVTQAAQQAEFAQNLTQLRAANEEAAYRLRQSQETVARLQQSLDALREARQSGSDARLRAQVDLATGLIDKAAETLKAGELAPRVYLHISREEQREAAAALRARIGTLRLDGVALVAPGVQLVEVQSNAGVLRCFAADECRGEAQKLLVLLNGQLRTPQLTLQDQSRQYANAKIRPGNYEVWFGTGEIVLRSTGATK